MHDSNPPGQFDSLETFYDARPARRSSPEAAYGVRWRMNPCRHHWRVSYIRDTGEVYAIPTDGDGPVLLLGSFPPDDTNDSRDVWYRGLDEFLDGWTEYYGIDEGLRWLWNRLQGRQEVVHQDLPNLR